jgi:hypothetical protein
MREAQVDHASELRIGEFAAAVLSASDGVVRAAMGFDINGEAAFVVFVFAVLGRCWGAGGAPVTAPL